jgi:hypothetical protein
MQIAYHLSGGAPVLKKLKIAATIANAGVLVKGGAAGDGANVIPTTTTDATECYGLGIDSATYSTTQGAAEGIVTVDVRPDLIVAALMSGGATEGTALAILTNTSASAGGTVVTAANVAANDMDGGTVWGRSGNNVGLSRTITAHTASTSVTVTVPFPRAIAVDDTYLMCPWNVGGDGAASGADGHNVQTTTLFTQADATIASGTGVEAAVIELELNGTSDSYVLFMVHDHVFGENAY